ncbi:hypothetical protein OIDMADRAFT_55744 [Oidiodendron maius Zn]|uniref:2EXR domain-containing protein n=1 Tax=Oidiodendron maius (strain Zn) TaxID=913774 RepID=A0A0C3HBU7_OIDMZ|nr:hypothetical protein OIDMADRAFT_55744 [Oidiodendron maius Zn]
MELRRRIWRFSWPEARVIEVANTEFNTEKMEYTGTTYLRLAGSFLTLLKTDFGANRTLDNVRPVEHCPPPVALLVCQESRRYTLSQYCLMQHAKSAAYSFFLNPSRDTLWFCRELTGQPECQRDLRLSYGEQLDKITTVLVEEAEWAYCTPVWYTLYCLATLRGLKTIVLVYGAIDGVGNLITETTAPDHPVRAEKQRVRYRNLDMSTFHFRPWR